MNNSKNYSGSNKKNYYSDADIATYEDVINELGDGTIVVWNKHVTGPSIWVETYVPIGDKMQDALVYNGKRYGRLSIYSGTLDEKTTIGGGMGDIYLKAIFHECGLMVAVREHIAKGQALEDKRNKAAKKMSVNARTNNI